MGAVGVLADDADPLAVLDPGVDHDALARVAADACAVGAEDARLRHRGQPLAHPEVEVVQRGGAELDQHLARRRRPDRARPRSAAPRARRPRGSESPSPGTISRMTAAELARLGGGARARRDRRGARRALRGDRAAHPRAARPRALRGHALHDGAARGLVPSRDAAAGRAHRRLGRALLLRPGAAARARGGPAAALHVERRLRRAAGAARRAGAARSAAPTACSSTRTSTSTARPPRGPASASTARTRC